MKISKKDLRRIIFEGVAASLEEKKKKKRGRRGKKDSETTAEDPPKSTVSEPSDPERAGTSEQDVKKQIMTLMSKAVEKHREKDLKGRDSALTAMKFLLAPDGTNVRSGFENTAAAAVKIAKEKMELILDFGPKVSAQPQRQAQTGRAAKPKRRSNPKTAYIQKVIKAPSSEGGKKEGDGQWGSKTSDAWRAWVKEPDTLKKFAALEKDLKKDSGSAAVKESQDLYSLFSKIISEQADESQPETAESETPESSAPAEETTPAVSAELKKLIDDGDAAALAKYFGLTGNLSGVTDLVKKLEAKKATDSKEEEKPKAAVDPDLYDATYLENLAEEGKLNMAAIPADLVITDDSEVNNKLSEPIIVDTNGKFKEMGDIEETGIVKKSAHPKTGNGARKYVIRYGDAYDKDGKKIPGKKDIKVDGIFFDNYYLPGYTKKKIGEKEYYVAKNYKSFMPDAEAIEDMKDAEKVEQLKALGMIEENKDIVGESHGTLIRKRYRRY